MKAAEYLLVNINNENNNNNKDKRSNFDKIASDFVQHLILKLLESESDEVVIGWLQQLACGIEVRIAGLWQCPFMPAYPCMLMLTPICVVALV